MDANKYLDSYAIIEFGGKQYQAVVGTMIALEKVEQEIGSDFIFDRVLLVKKSENNVLVGKPLVSGATVVAEIISQGKGPKLIAFRYKKRKRIRVKKGHRQQHTVFKIKEIAVI